MAEQLVFENESGETINEVLFRRTIKGIPSLITNFYVKNQSEDLGFKGRLNVVPTTGRSYSEDLIISETGAGWTRNMDFDIPAQERVECKIRVIPITTPPGISGRASVSITGAWY